MWIKIENKTSNVLKIREQVWGGISSTKYILPRLSQMTAPHQNLVRATDWISDTNK